MLCLLLLALPSLAQSKPRLRISDALEDVPDGEETEEWRSWGKRREAKPITGSSLDVRAGMPCRRLLTPMRLPVTQSPPRRSCGRVSSRCEPHSSESPLIPPSLTPTPLRAC